jgi:glutathione peroxidase
MKMRYIFSTMLFMASAIVTNLTAAKTPGKVTEIPDSFKNIVVKDMNGKEVKLSDYEGKVLLIVNVASRCGYTPQYKELEAIYEKYKDKGLEILGFPCNDFGGQEPGTNEEIKQFCTLNYNVSFKLFDKIKVLGDEKSPLYSFLINNPAVEKGDVKWNFEKFLIDKKGNPVVRFRSKVKPDSDEMIKAIEAQLAKN